jgi:hypothetical protein
MKTKSFGILALLLVFAMSLSASQTTVTGILTDDMCTKKHMMPGKPNADCVRECIKHGAKYVVVSEGKVLELNGKQEQLNQLAGKKVKLTGETKGKTFVVAAIEAAQ